MPASNEQMVISEGRVDALFSLILKGVFRFADYKNYAQEQGWNIGDRQLKNYIKRARVKFLELTDEQREENFGKSLARHELLFFQCLKIQDYKTALSVQKSLNDMFGFNKKNIDVKTDGEKLENNVILVIDGKEVRYDSKGNKLDDGECKK